MFLFLFVRKSDLGKHDLVKSFMKRIQFYKRPFPVPILMSNSTKMGLLLAHYLSLCRIIKTSRSAHKSDADINILLNFVKL